MCAAIASRNKRDLLIATILAVLAGIASYLGSGLVPTAILNKDATDVWFDADLSRVFDNMVSRFSDNKRVDVHPFFPLIGFIPVLIFKGLAGLGDWTAVRVVIAIVASVCVALLYSVLRCMGLSRWHAVLFTALAAFSATGTFWFILPETMPFGAATILLGLLFAIVATKRGLHPIWAIAANLATLGVTITNWAVAFFGTVAAYDKRSAARVTAYTVCIAVGLSALQLVAFPRAAPFGVSSRVVAEEPHFLMSGDAGGPMSIARAFVFHTMVMPSIQRSDHYWSWSKWPILRVQFSRIGSGTVWGRVSALLWAALLAIGAWGWWTHPGMLAFRLVVAAALLFQLALHTVFGRETFLYGPHILPLLLVVAAFGALTRMRHVVFALAALLLVSAAVNNLTVLRGALDLLAASSPATVPLQATIDLEPIDRQGMTVPPAAITLSDAQARVAGVVGPAGSYTIGRDDFIVSLWVLEQDRVKLTSDTHWSPSTQQRIVWPWQGGGFVETNNWYYRVTTRVTGSGTWGVDIAQDDNRMTRLAVLIRSASPERPIRALAWDGERLLINNRWLVRFDYAPAKVHVGEEEAPRRFVRSMTTAWQSDDKRGYALFELDTRRRWWQVQIADPKLGGMQ